MDIPDIRREPLELGTVFPKFSSYFLSKYRIEAESKHILVEKALELLHDDERGVRELFDVYGLAGFKNSCCQWNYGLALVLLVSGCSPIHLLHSYRLTNCDGAFVPSGDSREECLLAVLHDDFEYLVSAKHVAIDGFSVLSSLEAPSVISGTVYVKRLITDTLRSKNPSWDPVAFPVWLKTVDKEKVYYKVHERVPLSLAAISEVLPDAKGPGHVEA